MIQLNSRQESLMDFERCVVRSKINDYADFQFPEDTSLIDFLVEIEIWMYCGNEMPWNLFEYYLQRFGYKPESR